jgi:HK97 family phage major capsid protein
MKSLTFAGVAGLDPQEVSWLRTKSYTDFSKKTQSWLDETLGGALVAPPEMGELIQLLRNKDALVNAGARVVPMPPQGRLKLPRQTAATVGYWVGEKVQIPESQFKTGALNLSSKRRPRSSRPRTNSSATPPRPSRPWSGRT